MAQQVEARHALQQHQRGQLIHCGRGTEARRAPTSTPPRARRPSTRARVSAPVATPAIEDPRRDPPPTDHGERRAPPAITEPTPAAVVRTPVNASDLPRISTAMTTDGNVVGADHDVIRRRSQAPSHADPGSRAVARIPAQRPTRDLPRSPPAPPAGATPRPSRHGNDRPPSPPGRPSFRSTS